MPLPTLPPEVWFRISTYLSPASLHALSQVSWTLHEVATDETHFQRFVPSEYRGKASLLYRRTSALSFLPRIETTAALSSVPRIIYVVEKSVLILDRAASRIIAFPSGATIDIMKVYASRYDCMTPNDVRETSVVLPDSGIAFVNDAAHMRIWNIATGELTETRLCGTDALRELPSRHSLRNVAGIAGNNAEWIVYRVQGRLLIFDWRDGAFIKEVPNVSDSMLLRGECPSIDGVSIVGTAVEQDEETCKRVIVAGFDGMEKTFTIDKQKHVERILRSANKKKYVLITATHWHQHIRTDFIAKCDDRASKTWSGSLPIVAEPVLCGNGRVIAVKPGIFWHFRNSGNESTTLWVLLNEDGTTTSTTVSPKQLPLRWSHRTLFGGFVVIAHKRIEMVRLLKVVNTRHENSRMFRVREWPLEGLVDCCVVDDHFIVATLADGRVKVLHFDQFCGANRCTGLIPEEFRQGTERRRGKKERTKHRRGRA